MDLNTIQAAKLKYTSEHGEPPTTLNLAISDATKFLNDLIGKGLLPRDVQDKAVEAYAAGGEETLEFFKNATILGMKVKLFKVVS